jgi:ABC-type phosphate transport system substrate-binding protein
LLPNEYRRSGVLFAMEQTMMRSILKTCACAIAALSLYACASNPGPYNGQGDSPTAAGTSNVYPLDRPSRY